MLKVLLQIPETQVAYVQRHGFELDARKRIVEEIILTNTNNPSVLEGETFKKYHEKYQESSVAFELAKNELEKQFVPDVIKKANGITSWNLDYANCEMTITHTGSSFDEDYSMITFNVPPEHVQITVIPDVKAECCCGGNCK